MNLIPNRFVAGLMAGVASALLVAAAPAVAANPDNARSTAGAPAPAPTPATADADPVAAKPTHARYCIKDQITGSLISKKVCKTKQEWAAEGVDITAK